MRREEIKPSGMYLIKRVPGDDELLESERSEPC